MRQQTRSNSSFHQPNRFNATEVEKYLDGISFPCAKDDLIHCADDNGAPDDMIEMMEDFPEKTFNNPMDVARCVSQLQH